MLEWSGWALVIRLFQFSLWRSESFYHRSVGGETKKKKQTKNYKQTNSKTTTKNPNKMQIPCRTTENLNTKLSNLGFEVYFRPPGNRSPQIIMLWYYLLKMSVTVRTLVTNRNICCLRVKVRYSFCGEAGKGGWFRR